MTVLAAATPSRTPSPRRRGLVPSGSAAGVAPPPPAGVCAALSALGDAVAVLDPHSQCLCWASPAWLDLQPGLGVGSPVAELDSALPGLLAACGAAGNTDEPSQHAVGEARQWTLHLAALGDQRLLRLADRREQGRAVQRQLDDREQLLFTSRVISVGEMASTLAHELNQPIGATANLLRALRQRLSRRNPALDADEAGALDRAIEQVMFAAKVIARIREFTHSHQPKFATVDLVALLRSSASLLDWDLDRTGASVSVTVVGEPISVRGDEVMLQQVVVNLMRNALDALRTDPPDNPEVQLHLVRGDQDVELQVRDNGCGLGDEAAARLFVPFASSKPNGMGIGLSICRSFVELHQGRLWFSRNADRGATFHMSLPLLPQA
ncbi:histidine kinase [Burkholderiales bacterium JOSHI_001]|nr:histidine kinase [Burkholderiales bacterium JOSHI_001]